jgi:hypothetical protein
MPRVLLLSLFLLILAGCSSDRPTEPEQGTKKAGGRLKKFKPPANPKTVRE